MICMIVDDVLYTYNIIYVSHKSTFSSNNSTQITGGVLASKFKIYDVHMICTYQNILSLTTTR